MLRIYRKLKALTLAGGMILSSAVPFAVSAEEVVKEVNNTTPQEFVIPRINESVKQMTFDEFVEGVRKAYNELKRVPVADTKGKTEDEIKEADVNLIHAITCLYYVTNRAYLNDIRGQLISEGYIDESYIDNIMYAVGLVNTLNNYQQKTIRETENINDLVDISVFCFEDNDRRIVKEMFEHWFESHKMNTFNKKEYLEAFNILGVLNAQDIATNNSNASVGARWLAMLTIGPELERVTKDTLDTLPIEEVLKIYDREAYNAQQWTLKDGVVLDHDCETNLVRLLAKKLEQIRAILKVANNDMIKYEQFMATQVDCTSKSK